MIKKPLLIIMSFIILITCTGCWDRRELNELGIVLAIGIDKSENGGYVLTSQVVRPSAFASHKVGAEQSPIEIITSYGDTLFEAIRNTPKQFDRKNLFSHIEVIVLSEEIAREGLNPVLDFILRTHEIRKYAWIMISKDESARKTLGNRHGIESVQANYMASVIENSKLNSQMYSSSLIDVIKEINVVEINPILGLLGKTTENPLDAEEDTDIHKGITLSGTGIFKEDKLVGFLNNYETQGLNLIMGNVKSGVINITNSKEGDDQLAIEIKKTKSQLEPQFDIKKNEVSYKIKVTLIGKIFEIHNAIDVSEPKVVEKIEKKCEDYIKENINIAMNKVQKEYKSDVIGFGTTFYRKNPKQWKTIKSKWNDMFPDVKYTVEVNIIIKQTGLIIKPLNVKKE